MQVREHALHGRNGFGRGAERVFVRSKLDNAFHREVVLAGDFLDRAAGLVDREAGQGGIKSRENGHQLREFSIFFRSTFSAMRSRISAIFATSEARVLTIKS